MRRVVAVLFLAFFGGFERSAIAYDVNRRPERTEFECDTRGGHLANDSLYTVHPNLLVVYFDLAEPSIVYRHRNRTIRVPVDTSRISRIQSVRLFPETVTNFFAVYGGISKDEQSSISYLTRFQSDAKSYELPQKFTRETKHFLYEVIWRDFGFINVGAKHILDGLYNAKDCSSVFGFDLGICQSGNICRTQDFSNEDKDVANLCAYDAARNMTVPVELDVDWETAYGILQCNRFVSIKPLFNDSVAVGAVAVFHERRPTICFTHPKEWVEVYAIYLSNSPADYACRHLSEAVPDTLSYGFLETLEQMRSNICFFCFSQYNFFLLLTGALTVVAAVVASCLAYSGAVA